MTITVKAMRWPEGFHYWVSTTLALALVPLLKRQNLPVIFDWTGLLFGYWVVLAAKAIFAAALLHLVGFSPGQTIDLTWQRLRAYKKRSLLVLAYFVISCWLLNWVGALLLTVDSVAILELYSRVQLNGAVRSARAILPPAFYLFFGLLLVSAYNDIVLSVRFFAANDVAFNSMDRWLLRGHSVPEISHWALQAFPLFFFHFLELVYYGMFALLGAGLILTCQYYGGARGFQFVGAVLTAYYLALALFGIWPSQGPYYLCPAHFSEFPSTLATYGLQKGSIAGSQALWNHERLQRISFAYYIAFPCVHIAQPLIVMWFLRLRKRVARVLAGYNVVLVIAILLLEWHYVVDVLAGIGIAALAIASADGRRLRPNRDSTRIGIAEISGNVISQ